MCLIYQAMQGDAMRAARIHPASILVTGLKCSYGKISSPLTEIPVGKTEISGTEPSRWHIVNFTQDLEARRDLGNRTHAKKPLVVYVFAYPSVWDGLFPYGISVNGSLDLKCYEKRH